MNIMEIVSESAIEYVSIKVERFTRKVCVSK